MPRLLLRVFIEVAAWVALLRCLWVFYGLVEMVWQRGRDGRIRWDLSMLVCLPEPFLLVTAVVLLRWGIGMPEAAAAPASLGAGLSLCGFLISQWAFYSYRAVGTGHYLDPDHQVITTGAYGLVRHPLYLGVFLIWAGLALAFQSWGVLAVLAVYVVPAYTAYMRSEEELLLSNLGEAYASYQRRVPMLAPRFRRPSGRVGSL